MPTTNLHQDAAKAAELRVRAGKLREQGLKAAARAARMPEGLQRDMLSAQAGLLKDGARDLEAQALAMDPAMGTA